MRPPITVVYRVSEVTYYDVRDGDGHATYARVRLAREDRSTGLADLPAIVNLTGMPKAVQEAHYPLSSHVAIDIGGAV